MTTIDRRRNNGPVSVAPRFEESLDKDTAMLDPSAPATMFLQTRMIAHANGSAYLETPTTKLIVAVHGPRPTTQGSGGVQALQLKSVVTMAPFADLAEHEEKGLGMALGTALGPSVMAKRYPKSEIAVIVQVLEGRHGGDVLAAAVTASSAAMADAKIELFDLVSGVSITSEDERALVVGYMPNRQEMTLLQMNGGALEGRVELQGLIGSAVKQAEEVNLALNKVLLGH